MFIKNEHTDKHAHYRKTTVDDLGNTLADHLAQRIDIIRIDRHDVAVRMVVKIFDRQFFHMFKHFISKIPKVPCVTLTMIQLYRYVETTPIRIKYRNSSDRMCQRGKVRVSVDSKNGVI